jgi:hypothetical protein
VTGIRKFLKTLKCYVLFLSIIFIGLPSCATFHSHSRESENVIIPANPEIIFLNYSIKRTAYGLDPVIALTGKTITGGKLKENVPVTSISKPGDLKCITLNDRMTQIDTLIISDPLNITVESVNDNNQLFKKELSLDSAEFTIRMQLKNNVRSVAIIKGTDTWKQGHYLLLSPINMP